MGLSPATDGERATAIAMGRVIRVVTQTTRFAGPIPSFILEERHRCRVCNSRFRTVAILRLADFPPAYQAMFHHASPETTSLVFLVCSVCTLRRSWVYITPSDAGPMHIALAPSIDLTDTSAPRRPATGIMSLSFSATNRVPTHEPLVTAGQALADVSMPVGAPRPICHSCGRVMTFVVLRLARTSEFDLVYQPEARLTLVKCPVHDVYGLFVEAMDDG